MSTQIDFYRYFYDDAHPAFINLPHPPQPLNEDGDIKFVYHRGTGRIFDLQWLNAAMAEQNYTPGADEIGSDDEWLFENTDFLGSYTPPAPDDPVVSTVAGITFTVTGAGTDTINILVEGTSDAAATATCETVSIDGSAMDPAPSFEITSGQTAVFVSVALYNALVAGETADGVTLSGQSLPAPTGANVILTNDGSPGIFDTNFSIVEV